MELHPIYFVVSSLFFHYTSATPFDVTPESILQPGRSNCACDFPVLKPMDCEQILQLGYNESGVYKIWPNNKIMDNRPIHVFCDMETDKGGWTVIQRRGNFLRSIDYFRKNWTDYKSGFGNIEEEFWLGNDNIFVLTNQRQYSVRFDLTDRVGDHRYALYDIFFIEDEENKYRLTIQEYSGTANDSMISTHNGRKFSTEDQNNGAYGDNGFCAKRSSGGGWWYGSDYCFRANLNGLNIRGKVVEKTIRGMMWQKWKNTESLDKTEIKIRPKNFLKKTKVIKTCCKHFE